MLEMSMGYLGVKGFFHGTRRCCSGERFGFDFEDSLPQGSSRCANTFSTLCSKRRFNPRQIRARVSQNDACRWGRPGDRLSGCRLRPARPEDRQEMRLWPAQRPRLIWALLTGALLTGARAQSLCQDRDLLLPPGALPPRSHRRPHRASGGALWHCHARNRRALFFP